MMLRGLVILSLMLALADCGATPEEGATILSIIGEKAGMMSTATAQGLVAFDADGQIEPALAERWIASDDGLSLVFRLTRTTWSNGRTVLASDVANSLRASFAQAPNGRLGHLFNAVEDVVPMTDRVVEIRLKEPRPNMLQLLAQPEFSIRHNGWGAGPFLLQKAQQGATVLRPARETDGSDDALSENELRAREIWLRSDSAALGITRYSRGRAQAMLGGGFADFAMARVAGLRPSQMVVDPVRGLFGLAFVSQHPLTADRALRQALDMTIDRAALAQALDLPFWQTRSAVLPARLDGAAEPIAPEWDGYAISVRRAEAARRIANAVSGAKIAPPLRVALPDGAGARLLFARIAADWRSVGVSAELVGWHDAADVRLIDEVAPSGSVNWYFTRLSCAAGLLCDRASDEALKAARGAATLDERAQRYAKADEAYAVNTPFITLGNPYRWSLTSARLNGLHASPFGVHPLIHVKAAGR